MSPVGRYLGGPAPVKEMGRGCSGLSANCTITQMLEYLAHDVTAQSTPRWPAGKQNAPVFGVGWRRAMRHDASKSCILLLQRAEFRSRDREPLEMLLIVWVGDAERAICNGRGVARHATDGIRGRTASTDKRARRLCFWVMGEDMAMPTLKLMCFQKR